jgi:hypothetical protein
MIGGDGGPAGSSGWSELVGDCKDPEPKASNQTETLAWSCDLKTCTLQPCKSKETQRLRIDGSLRSIQIILVERRYSAAPCSIKDFP